MRKNIFTLILVFGVIFGHSQQIPIGHWRDHLPYSKTISLSEDNNRIYCATPYSIFYYNKADNSLERLTKVEGLSDVGISKVDYNQTFKTLVVAYTNTNVDLIKDGDIVNISDIKRKQIIGNKSINNILLFDNSVYLSCGFGIVVIDIEKEEIKDTYYIGPDGTHLNVLDLAVSESAFFAATKEGIYTAAINSPNLTNFASWEKITSAPGFNSTYNQIEWFDNSIIVNKQNEGYNDDELYKYDGFNWELISQPEPSDIHSIRVSNNELLLSRNMDVLIYNSVLSFERKIWSINDASIFPKDAFIDLNNQLWIADDKNGLIRVFDDDWNGEYIKINGPDFTDVFSMKVVKNDLWVTAGGRNSVWAPLYKREGFYSLTQDSWTSYNCLADNCTYPELSEIRDMVSLAIDPYNSNRVFIGTWGSGIIEVIDGSIINTYNDNNSTLQRWNADPSRILVSDMEFDKFGNLWVANSGADNLLSVKMMDESWQSFDLGSANSGIDISNLYIDEINQKWIILRKAHSLLVFYDNNTISDTSDDEVRVLNANAGSGNIFASEILCLTGDLNGELWIGTDEGIGVIYAPENVFRDGNFDVNRITLEWDDYAEYLLETERITAIAVDGANQKWIGTESSGVYLLSENGTEQIHHFTAENHPLLSNSILTIAVNADGEVFFGTGNGIISYRAEAAESGNGEEVVYAFPNPVREEYEGSIAIKNLPLNATVKITNISGGIVFETTAKGRQAIWDGKNFDGQKVQTGVYLVFASSEDGATTVVTKILFIN
ncbi:MAG: hypothetical protein GY834_03005 [Bacteroidetes bacterium]|nr:hypothetical protein [Bacteroidota bacterium]